MEKISIEERQFLAGFLDGDGCVSLAPSKWHAHPHPMVIVGQAHNDTPAPELVRIQKSLGGTIRRARAKSSKIRDQWILTISVQSDARVALEVLAQYGIVKRPQAIRALAYISGGSADQNAATAEMAAMKANYHTVEVLPERITKPYAAGLFSAEGSVFLYRSGPDAYKLRATITQKSCVPLLEAIVSMEGAGYINDGALAFSAIGATNFLQSIYQFLCGCQKEEQVRIAVEWHNKNVSRKRAKRGAEFIEETRATAERLKQLKKQ